MFVGYMAASTTPPTTCAENPYSDSGSITSTGVQNSSGNLGWSTGFCGNSDGIECNAYSDSDDWVCSDLTTAESIVSLLISGSGRVGSGLRRHSRLAPMQPPMYLTNAPSQVLRTRKTKNFTHNSRATLQLRVVKCRNILCSLSEPRHGNTDLLFKTAASIFEPGDSVTLDKVLKATSAANTLILSRISLGTR